MKRPPDKVFVIAEAGVNHNGDLNLAMRLIDVARDAQADAVKFQTFKPGEVTGKYALKVAYLERTSNESESRHELSRKLALPYEAFRALKAHADQAGILFLSTPDGFESLDFLVDELRLPLIKVGSTEVTHRDYLLAIGRKAKPVLFSTGLSTLGEVEKGLGWLCAGGAPEVTLLHCTSEYPAPDEELNVRAITTLQRSFQRPVGFSDHSLGFEAAVAAVALGARVIEKHFTLDQTLPGPDHPASLNPSELAAYVRHIRRAEKQLGDGIKQPTASEIRNRPGIRRSLVAARPIAKDTRLTRELLTSKRPGTGIEPEWLDTVLGFRLNRDLDEDEVLTWDHLK